MAFQRGGPHVLTFPFCVLRGWWCRLAVRPARMFLCVGGHLSERQDCFWKVVFADISDIRGSARAAYIVCWALHCSVSSSKHVSYLPRHAQNRGSVQWKQSSHFGIWDCPPDLYRSIFLLTLGQDVSFGSYSLYEGSPGFFILALRFFLCCLPTAPTRDRRPTRGSLKLLRERSASSEALRQSFELLNLRKGFQQGTIQSSV